MLTKLIRRMFSFNCKNLRTLKKETGLKIDMKSSNIVFGQDFTIHMAEVDFCEKAGWSTPMIKPLENLSLHPGCSAIHYSLSCFEGTLPKALYRQSPSKSLLSFAKYRFITKGLKVFRGANNEPRFFRIEDHMERFSRSCARLAFPSFDTNQMRELIEQLVKIDLDFLPEAVGECLYIRPTAMSTTFSLGVKRADSVKFFVMMSPVKKYFAGPIHLAVCETYDRGSNQSANAYKLGANYAPTVAITSELNKKGISQALWLNNGNILESGATNIFFISRTTENGEKWSTN